VHRGDGGQRVAGVQAAPGAGGVMPLPYENATQRGTTAAASLDAVAAVSRLIAEVCLSHDLRGSQNVFETLPPDAVASIWGKARKGRVFAPRGSSTSARHYGKVPCRYIRSCAIGSKAR